MCDAEVFLATSAATIVFLSTVLVQKLEKKAKKILDSSESTVCSKYNAINFMRDLILDDEDLLSFEY